MVIDTSAFLAILGDEPERLHFNGLIATLPSPAVSAGTLLETTIVVQAKYGKEGVRDLKLLLSTASIEVVPFDAEQASLATEAYSHFGKGRHKAGLNFGDCFSYALARSRHAPLLFKGEDFTHTDVESATHR